MALDNVTAEEIALIPNMLNNRPRKLLGYKTPYEIYDAMCLAAESSGVALVTVIRAT
jgi:IS30 family transposase